VVGDEAPHRGRHLGGVGAELQQAGAVAPPGITSSRLSRTGAARYSAQASSTNGWSSAAATSSTGTRSRDTAAAASTPWKLAGPDRLTTPATGGRILVAADSTAVPPMEEPISTIRSAPRRRSCAAAATTSLSTRASGPAPGWESPEPAKSNASTW
jgi:hypothetical protein